MKLSPFRLEEYLATREFSSKYMFCASDMTSRTIGEVLELASDDEKKGFMNLSLSYTLPEGSAEVRREIAAMYTGLTAANVLCFAGAEEAIFTAAQCFLSSSDHAVTIGPCYQSLESVAASICDVTIVDLELKGEGWHLDVQKVEAAIRPNTKMLFFNFPHNPTGYVPSHDVFDSLIDLAKRHNLVLFSDEVYRGLEMDIHHCLPSAAEVYPRALSLGVMSKSFGFAGLRIGWITSQSEHMLQQLSNFKHYLSICNSAPSEWLTKIILKNRTKVLDENIALLKTNLEYVRGYFLANAKTFQWIEPQGGCIAYPRYLGQQSVLAMADALLQKKSVVILPDWVYGQENQHFRVSFGRRDCRDALKHFSDFFLENPEWKY